MRLIIREQIALIKYVQETHCPVCNYLNICNNYYRANTIIFLYIKKGIYITTKINYNAVQKFSFHISSISRALFT